MKRQLYILIALLMITPVLDTIRFLLKPPEFVHQNE